MIWITVLIFVVLLLILVLVHEWGHFYAAKKAGCKVEEFGFGFPPRLFAFKKGETTYSFNLFPIGGFVKIEGENMDGDTESPDNFASKSATWRVVILAAGVFMNMVVAALFLMIQAGIGMPVLVTDENREELSSIKTYIMDVNEGSPAAEAGLQSLDRIVRLEETTDPNVTEVQAIIAANAGNEISLEIERQGQRQNITATPREEVSPDEGLLGVSLASTGLHKVPWWQAPWEGLKRTWLMLTAILTQFGLIIQRIFSEGTVGEALTGPVGIAVYAHEVTQMGASYLLEFAALISINLAIINLLPFPALDGGRIMFVLAEKIWGRRLPQNFENISHLIGFGLLILLMIVITFRDVQRFF